MEPWLQLLLGLLALAIVAVLVFWIVEKMKLPEPVNMIAHVILGIILIIAIFAWASHTGIFAGSLG